MIIDSFKGKELIHYISYGSLINIFTIAIGPFFGGYLQHYFGWRASFFFLTIWSFMMLLISIFKIPETNTHKHPENLNYLVIKYNLLQLIAHRSFVGYSLCSLLTYAALSAWLTAGPVLLLPTNKAGLTPISYGYTYALTSLPFVIGILLNNQLTLRFGINATIRLGLIIIFLSGMLLLSSHLAGLINAEVIIGPVMLFFFRISLGSSKLFCWSIWAVSSY